VMVAGWLFRVRIEGRDSTSVYGRLRNVTVILTKDLVDPLLAAWAKACRLAQS
jgi:hypothetical protein